MTSAEFKSFPIDSILVDRESRQRREIDNAAVETMADSFRRLGQINPITISRDGTLVAGETRFLAARELGWTHISVQFVDELDPRVLLSIELEENIKRTDLSWQDQVAAVSKYHELQRELNKDWSQKDTANALGISSSTVEAKIGVAKAIAKGDTRVTNADKFSTARNIVARTNERARVDEASLLPEVEYEEKVLNVDFLKWAPKYDGPSFNLLHCDFPYGINADSFNQGAAGEFGGYADTPEHYFRLINCLIDNRGRLLGNSAHILFWFSMTFYQDTLNALRKAFWVDPQPLIWHKSDNKGTLPWPDKSCRRIYETAFLCSHGDRKLIQSTSNLFSAPMSEREHMSEKSEVMLKHFFKMFVDENTRLLDPTAGSGSALRAAEALGARTVLGLEVNSEFAKNANRSLRK